MYTIASLSEQGWVSDPRAILSYVVTCYMLTDAAQTQVFSSNIKSLSQTYYLHINDPDAMASAMTADLSTMLSYYFASVDINARAKEISGKHYAIILQVSVLTNEGERIDLAKMMEIDSASLRKVIQINNYGEGQSALELI